MKLLNLRFSNAKFYPDNESHWITKKSIIFNLPTTNIDLAKMTAWDKNESSANPTRTTVQFEWRKWGIFE